MNEKKLTVPQVCSIIKAGANWGVASIHWGDLQIQFRGSVQTALDPIRVPPAIAERQEKIEKDNLEDVEIQMKEEELEFLKIENPAEFERQLLSGDLEKVSKVGDFADGDEAGYSGTE